jgi:hypothetical protein
MRKLSIALLVTLAPFTSTARAEEAPTRLLVPAYFYPSRDGLKAWETLLASSEKAPIVAIVNPASGPGKRVNENYTALVQKASKSKAALIGYVTLSYGKRPLADVKAEVDRWVEFYPSIQGIFFDEQTSQADGAKFALEAFAHVRSKIAKAAVISNPGTTCAEEYANDKNGATVCLFEGPGGFAKYRLPAWAEKANPDRIAALTYKVATVDAMKEAIREAKSKRAGYVYVTDADGRNPWNRLPTYWADEVAAIQSR